MLYRLFQKLIWIVVILLPPAVLHAQDKDQDTLPDTATVVYWQENGVRRQAWMATDEVAVFRGKFRGKTGNGAAARKFVTDVSVSVPEKDILSKNSFVSVIRTPNLGAARPASPPAMEHRLRQAAPSLPERPVSAVFYPQKRKIPATRMALTGEIIVRFDSAPTVAELEAVETNFGLTMIRAVTPKAFLYQAATPWESLEKANALQKSGMVGEATPHWYRSRATRQIADPLAAQQWHLANSGQGGGLAGADANVAAVWNGYLGSATQVIAIVDGAVEIGHEDLQENVRSGLSWDFVGDQDDPGGEPDDSHGTACAGVAAARGFNGIGGIGAAPLTGLAGIRLLGAESDVNESLALTHHSEDIAIYSNSWGPVDDGMHLEGPGPLTLEAIKLGTETGRGGKGNIYVWAGGNGRGNSDNSNYDGYANLRQTLAIAASTDQGLQASYSEPGANLLVNAPSNGGLSQITTTDRTGQPGYSATNYTATFGGTSAAAPLVAGVIALMLEANPSLTWRDVRWILAHTAQINDPGHPDWVANGAGLAVNHSYGFGRIDGLAAVTMSESWPGLAVGCSVTALVEPGSAIPDNDPSGISSSVEIDDDFTVEFVDITFSAPDHPYWGDLEVVLTSPAGTRSVLAERHSSGRTTSYDNWRFGSTRHLGESSRGTWTLTVRDLSPEDTGTLTGWRLEIHGHEGREPGPVKILPGATLMPALMLLLEE